MGGTIQMASSRRREARRSNDSAAISVKSSGSGYYHVTSSVPEAAKHGCCLGETVDFGMLEAAMKEGLTVLFSA